MKRATDKSTAGAVAAMDRATAQSAAQTARAVGDALQALRLKRGLSGQEVRRKSGVPNLTLVERGLASIGDMSRVALALGTTLTDVLRAPPPGLPETPPHWLTHVGSAILSLPGPGSKVEAAVSAAVLEAIRRTGDNQSEAARLLGMERKAFIRRLMRARRTAKGRKR